MVRSQRGHRALPHTADVILEAWGPDLASCCEEAVAALVAVYADASGANVVDHRRVHVEHGPEDELLLALLEEMIFLLDTSLAVPVHAQVSSADDGGLDAVIALAEPGSVVGAGAVPKAVSRSDLLVESGPGEVRCRFLVDV